MVLEKDLKTKVYEGVESEELIRIPSSEQDFLSLAYEVPFKIEYHNSEIIVIGLSAFVHELIITNVVSSFMNLIEDDSELTLLGSNLGVVSVGLSVSYFLPDLKIVKGKPVFVENTTSIIKNPTVVFEVMSPSTKSYDLTEKLEVYKTFESLEQVVFINQDKMKVTTYCRSYEPIGWLNQDFTKAEEMVEIEEKSLLLSDIYHKVIC